MKGTSDSLKQKKLEPHGARLEQIMLSRQNPSLPIVTYAPPKLAPGPWGLGLHSLLVTTDQTSRTNHPSPVLPTIDLPIQLQVVRL